MQPPSHAPILLIHMPVEEGRGDYVRIANLCENVYSRAGRPLIEVVLSRPWPLAEIRQCANNRILPGATKRIILPIRTPVWNSRLLYRIASSIQFLGGRVIGWLHAP